jgi:hypothetical protein
MRRRSLWPREHGAYFQLAIPLVTACVVRSPTVPSIALAVGAALAFLANEPLLVVLGHRGPRRKAVDGTRAQIRLAILAGGALVLGAFGLLVAPHAMTAAATVTVPTILLLAFAWRRAEHTLAGELVAAIALTGASVPVLVAAGSSLAVALEVWLAWAIGFGATVLAVHRVIARHKSAADVVDVVLAASMIALAFGAASGWAPLLLSAPLVGVSAVLVMAPPAASRLRAIGVAIVIASIVTGGLVLARV